ncbi:4Fe-4S binding protein [Adlercreutzia sp. ZJ473]|uniref:4Fe-4S binding protein n=1 Tax=Adlercreutzia sp. ZJ473 TaxID=2722822 RepID=UPI0015523D77|nr:4Fe-4S binding protein [Adlercreutzia sp. ZJ473]
MNKMRYARVACALLVLALICASTELNMASGTLCVPCPVGVLEISLASGSVPWALLPGMAVLLLAVLALGRAFCSWVCPTSLTRNLFGGRHPRGLTGRTGEEAAGDGGAVAAATGSGTGAVAAADDSTGAAADGAAASGGADASSAAEAPRRERNNLATQGIVLAVLLAVSFAVHFPVFCLICPIGLAMGTVFAASRTFMTWQPELELLAFPAMLLVEALALRRWCSAICPLGFFFGLAAKARTALHLPALPRLNAHACRMTQGCRACEHVCPENIHLPAAAPADREDCTLCLDCAEHCPAHALTPSPARHSNQKDRT